MWRREASLPPCHPFHCWSYGRCLSLSLLVKMVRIVGSERPEEAVPRPPHSRFTVGHTSQDHEKEPNMPPRTMRKSLICLPGLLKGALRTLKGALRTLKEALRTLKEALRTPKRGSQDPPRYTLGPSLLPYMPSRHPVCREPPSPSRTVPHRGQLRPEHQNETGVAESALLAEGPQGAGRGEEDGPKGSKRGEKVRM